MLRGTHMFNRTRRRSFSSSSCAGVRMQTQFEGTGGRRREGGTLAISVLVVFEDCSGAEDCA